MAEQLRNSEPAAQSNRLVIEWTADLSP